MYASTRVSLLAMMFGLNFRYRKMSILSRSNAVRGTGRNCAIGAAIETDHCQGNHCPLKCKREYAGSVLCHTRKVLHAVAEFYILHLARWRSFFPAGFPIPTS